MEIITEILMILLGIPIYFSWKLTQYRLINTWIDDLQFFSPRRVFIPQGVRVRMHTPVGYCNSFHFFQDKVCSFYDADVVILYNFSCRFSLRHTFIISTTFLNKKNTQSAVQNPGKHCMIVSNVYMLSLVLPKWRFSNYLKRRRRPEYSSGVCARFPKNTSVSTINEWNIDFISC